MLIGSHNTMTYLRPRKWWMWLGRFVGKCQKHTIYEQYERGARWFDIRIAFENKNGIITPIFAHGLLELKGLEPEMVFAFINSKDDVYCRIVLEKNEKEYLEIFKEYVEKWLNEYSNLKVTQIAVKGKWDNLFPDKTISAPYPLKDAYASNNGNYPEYSNLPGILKSKVWSGWIYDDLYPWIYTVFHNKKNLEYYKDEKIILLIDFV